MQDTKENVKYPDNLYLRDLIRASGQSVKYVAVKINVSRQTVSNTINGHYKGENIVPLIENHLKLK